MMESMTVDEYRALMAKKPARSKFRNTPTTVDGVRFASQREAARWGELVMMQRAGVISELKRQVRFALEVNGVLIGHYTADAVYMENGVLVVEDTKPKLRESKRKAGKRKQPPRSRDYILRRKLMLAVHGIEVKEV